jgi:hypothetical protein
MLHEYEHPVNSFTDFWLIIWLVFNDILLLAKDIYVWCIDGGGVVRCWFSTCSLGFSIRWLKSCGTGAVSCFKYLVFPDNHNSAVVPHLSIIHCWDVFSPDQASHYHILRCFILLTQQLTGHWARMIHFLCSDMETKTKEMQECLKKYI